MPTACADNTILTVSAGPHDRTDCVVTAPCADCPGSGAHLLEPVEGPGEPLVAQCGAGHGTFLLPHLAAGETRQYRVGPAVPAGAGGVTITSGDHRYDFRVGDRLFTSYLVGPEFARPHCLPVLGPGGVNMTRTEPGDHPHHRSIYVAMGSVNGFDNWSEEPGHARTVNRSCTIVAQGPVYAELLAENDWETPEGRKLLAETTRLTVYALPGEARMMDWDITWTAAYGGVFFGDTKEAGTLSVRVAESLRVDHGGRMVNGYGGVGEGECWGQPAPWVDYSGLSEGRQVGLALFDHPANFRYPTPWHVRNYGLFTANCWGLHDFTGDWSVRGDYALPAGQALHWTFRVYIHEGDEQTGRVGERWLDFAYPPRVTVTTD
jgi:hypothetical protein